MDHSLFIIFIVEGGRRIGRVVSATSREDTRASPSAVLDMSNFRLLVAGARQARRSNFRHPRHRNGSSGSPFSAGFKPMMMTLRYFSRNVPHFPQIELASEFPFWTTARRMLIMSITAEGNQPMTMKNPPHPGGVVLRQSIEPLGLTITEAAFALGVTRNTLSELVNGKRGISPEIAVRLSKIFGGSEDGWLVLRAQYEVAQVRRDCIKLKRLQLA